MNIGGVRLGWLRRRWWVLVACVVGVTLIGLIVNRPTDSSYTGEAVLIVRSGATENTPGNANEANRLAVTYSQLIPQDSETLNWVSNTLGIARNEVADAISASNDANTSILRVRYTASSSSKAVDGARAVAGALVGASPAATNFRGVGLSRLPDTASKNESSGTGLPVAMLIGLLLGIVLVVALERNNGQIDSIDDLEAELNCPVTALQGLSAGSILSLLQRWKALAGTSPCDIALVTASEGQRALTQEVAIVFATTANSDEANPVDDVTLFATGAPSTWEVGEATMQRTHLTVLVIAEGSSVKALRHVLDGIESFGALPAWALYSSDAVSRRARRHHGIGEDVAVAIHNVQQSAPSLTS